MAKTKIGKFIKDIIDRVQWFFADVDEIGTLMFSPLIWARIKSYGETFISAFIASIAFEKFIMDGVTAEIIWGTLVAGFVTAVKITFKEIISKYVFGVDRFEYLEPDQKKWKKIVSEDK